MRRAAPPSGARIRRFAQLASVALIAPLVAAVVPSLAASEESKPAAGDTHRFSYDDATRIESLGRVQIAPRGSLVAVERGTQIEVWSYAGSPKRVLSVEGSQPLWSPDGKELAFYCERLGHRQLCRSSLTGEITQITHEARGISTTRYWSASNAPFSWSPDSRSLAFVTRVCEPQSPAKTDPRVLGTSSLFLETYEGVYRHDSLFLEKSPDGPSFDEIAASNSCGLNRLFLVRADGTGQSEIPTQGGHVFVPAWSPRGDQIAFIFDKSASLVLPESQHTSLALLNVRSRKMQEISGPYAKIKLFRWRPDGRALAVVWEGEYSDWGEFGQAATWDASSGKWAGLGHLEDRSVEDVHWSMDQTLIVRVDGRFSDQLLKFGSSRSEGSPLLDMAGSLGEFDITRGGDIAFTAGSSGNPSRLFAWRLGSTSPPTMLLDPNPQLATVELGQQGRLTWQGEDGFPHDAIYIRPPGFEPGKRYPLVVDVYPHEARDHFRAGTNSELGQLQAAWGYVVLLADPRGSVSRLYDFSLGKGAVAAASGVAGKRTAIEDISAGIQALRRMNLIDDKRICVFGHSNGGYVAAVVATEAPTMARCIVISESYTNMISADLTFGDDPWDRGFAQADLADSPQTYVELSPIFKFSKITASMLLIDGDKDWLGCLPDMLMQFTRLKKLGKKVELIRYPEEDHYFTRAEDIKDRLSRIQQFFAENIGNPPQ